MCKIPKVLLVAPADKHVELRKALSSLEYDFAAAVESAEDAAGITADVVVAWEPNEETLRRLRELSFKVVALGGDGSSADMQLAIDDAASFKTRIWELFRPA